MNTKTLFFTLSLLTVVTLSSILALLAAQKIATPHINASQNPDFFITNALYTEFDQTGAIHNQIATSKISHFTTANAYLFDNPQMTFFYANEQPWIISAHKGKSEHGKDKILLWDNVTIQQAPGANNTETLINTNSLTLFPNTKTAETKEPVTIKQGGSVMHAVGAKADFKAGTVKLLSKVGGTYKQ